MNEVDRAYSNDSTYIVPSPFSQTVKLMHHVHDISCVLYIPNLNDLQLQEHLVSSKSFIYRSFANILMNGKKIMPSFMQLQDLTSVY